MPEPGIVAPARTATLRARGLALQVGDMDTDFAVLDIEIELDADHLPGLLDAQDPLVKLSVSHAPRLSHTPADGLLALRSADFVGPLPTQDAEAPAAPEASICGCRPT